MGLDGCGKRCNRVHQEKRIGKEHQNEADFGFVVSSVEITRQGAKQPAVVFCSENESEGSEETTETSCKRVSGVFERHGQADPTIGLPTQKKFLRSKPRSARIRQRLPNQTTARCGLRKAQQRTERE
ncbi:hypothetical protein L6R29_01050 [Myxococcota bacterium]|nr:hypothetical protein [Myxococcota bacterium]